MTRFSSLLATVKILDDYNEKKQFSTFIITSLEGKQIILSQEEKAEMSEKCFSEIFKAGEVLSSLSSYKEKDIIFEYTDQLFAIITYCFDSPRDIPDNILEELKAYQLTVEKERFVENEVDHVFDGGHHSKYEMEHLMEVISPVKDEYQRGMLYSGMLHYKEKLEAIPRDAKEVLSDYMAAEFKRYLSGDLTEEMADALEVACDVCHYVLTDELIALLYEVLKLGRANLSYYAADTLMKAGRQIPDETISVLAKDLEYARLTYALLRRHKQDDRFPSEYASDEYLAKSDMIRWLVYPTELGEMPEAIEYLGKVKKKDVYFIFRFKSHSKTLDAVSQGEWLIGWASPEGGTFSNFDLYKNFEQKTVEKTLKYIKRKLL